MYTTWVDIYKHDDCFYIALFSALEQTHMLCKFTVTHSESHDELKCSGFAWKQRIML